MPTIFHFLNCEANRDTLFRTKMVMNGRNSPGSATTAIKHLIVDKDKCVYCNHRLGTTKDHVIPRVLGGRGGANYVRSCDLCNRRKGDYLPSELATDPAKVRLMLNSIRKVNTPRFHEVIAQLHKWEITYASLVIIEGIE